MRIILMLLLLIPLILLTAERQESSDQPPDIELREFSCSAFRGSDSSRTNGNNNKADTRSRELVYRQQIQNRNSIENRSRDMLELEQNVMRDSVQAKPVDMFRYRVTVKNIGMKDVKFVFWDYQSSEDADFAEVSHRQFRCDTRIKPNQSERLEGISTLPPIRVITANGAGKTFNQKVIINRIEYVDGTSWQRSTWQLPQTPLIQSGKGNCQPL